MAFMKRQIPGHGAIGMSVILGLFFFSSMLRCGIVHSVDIDGYNSNTACSGAGKSCLNIATRVCCQFSGQLPRAARIGYLDVCQFGVIYTGNTQLSCKTSLASQPGQGRKCFLGYGSIWGADWYSAMRSASCGTAQTEELNDDELKLAHQSEATCTSTVLPNAVIYSSDSSQGKWVLDLHADKHDALLSQLETVEDHNKENWLQSQGAYYVKDEPVN